jgi:hypothetical protein
MDTGIPTVHQWINEKTGATWYEINVKLIPPSLNVKLRNHRWGSGRERDKWLMLLQVAVRKIPPATGLRKITFIRHGHGLLDDDNLAGAFKTVRDLLRPPKAEQGVYGPKTKRPGIPWTKSHPGLSLILGDGPGEAHFIYQQERVGTKIQPWTTIYIEDVLDGRK